jgi:hypothetical protein
MSSLVNFVSFSFWTKKERKYLCENISFLVTINLGVSESKQTPSCNKLFFLINSRCGLNPSTSNQTEQASQATSEFTGTSNVEDYDGEDTLMTSQEEELDEHFLANEESDNITKRKALITAECPQGRLVCLGLFTIHNTKFSL